MVACAQIKFSHFCCLVTIAILLLLNWPSLLRSMNFMSSLSGNSAFVMQIGSPLTNKTLQMLAERKFVVLTRDKLSNYSLNKLIPLFGVLEEYPWLLAVTGRHQRFKNWTFCSLKRLDEFSVALNDNWSDFGKSSKIQTRAAGVCFACDLLPDVFVVRSSLVQESLPIIQELDQSAYLHFFLQISGKAAYCPSFDMTSVQFSSSEDFTCNNLPVYFDQKFAFLPKTLGIWRLVLPGPREAWLGCFWSRETAELDLPIACKNWIWRLLTDITDLLTDKFKLEYRVTYGTLLGAIRDKDIIPWTRDADLVLPVPYGQWKSFAAKSWSRLDKISHWKYSWNDKFDSPGFGGMETRVFFRCPPVFPSRGVGQIWQEIQKNHGSISTLDKGPYMDLYPSDHHDYDPACYKKASSAFRVKPAKLQIRGREFPGMPDPEKFLDCYIKDWRSVPNCGKGNWSRHC